MRRIQLRKLIELGEETRHVAINLDASKGINAVDTGPSGTDHELYLVMKNMTEFCRTLGARKTRSLVESRLLGVEDKWLNKPEGWDELYLLVDAFKKDVEERLFLYMPPAEAEYYQNGRLLSSEARAAFPKASQELRSAGTAYACALPTACVFHCMRALEHGLGALASDVGLKWEKEQWHTIIQQTDAQIKVQQNTLPKGLAKDERLSNLSQAATEFMYFKDGWRNYVAHNRVTYEAPQALEVLEHVCACIERLVDKLGLQEAS